LMQTAERLPRPDPLPFVPTMIDSGRDDTAIAPFGGPVESMRARPRPEPISEPVSLPAERSFVRARPPRRKGRVAALIVAFVLAMGAAAGAVAWSRSNTPTYKVPPLVSLTEAQAGNLVADYGFEIHTVQAHDENAAEGVIIAQSPASGAHLARGGRLDLTVSSGPADRAVPDLTGATLTDVDQRLTAAGLVRGNVMRVKDETAPKDSIMDWSYKGATVKKGTAVDLTVSDGPAQRAVPDLKGLTLDDAKAKLADPTVHLTAGDATEAFDPTIPKGQVVATTPPAGTMVDRDAVIAFVVSKGPDLVAVPDVSGMTLDQAVAALTAKGFTPGDVSGKAKKNVLQTDPRIGQLIPRGSKVDIILG
jgi:eukaryotic-like serine/threonine-protein kinase